MVQFNAITICSRSGCSPIIAPPSDAWEISFDKLTLGAIIGRGAFGKVVKAFLDTPVSTPAKRSSLSCEKDLPPRIIVAVKMLLGIILGSTRQLIVVDKFTPEEKAIATISKLIKYGNTILWSYVLYFFKFE